MALRQIQVILSQEKCDKLREILGERNIIHQWDSRISDSRILFNILLKSEETEKLTDQVCGNFKYDENFRMVILPVEASLPREDEEKKEEEKEKENGDDEEKLVGVSRISREELYNDITDSAKINTIYIAMVALSTIVAALGLIKNNVPVIIGAMVIAPLLGSNVALSLGTTLGDMKLVRRAFMTGGVGAALVLAISVLFGFMFEFDLNGTEIAVRTVVERTDIAIALASGAAAGLAFTTGVSSILVGVMVAVAILPPLVTCGLLVGKGAWEPALGAGFLVLVNVICINLAGVVTFIAQGVRPRTWWESKQAGRATRVAITVWVLLLAILIFILWLAQGI